MKRKEFRIANGLIAVLVLGFVILTIVLSANQGLDSIVKESIFGSPTRTRIAASTASNNCSKNAPLNLGSPTDGYLKRLKSYQNVCGSFVTNTIMAFTTFPQNTESAHKLADQVSTRLKAFKDAGVTPLMVAEPYLDNGLMPYKAYLAGNYDKALNTFFNDLKTSGITDTMMGTWVPFPESNTPAWDNKDTEPRDFALAVNRYLNAMKDVFPQAKGSIMLDATTYDPNDIEYNNGNYLSLVPYIQDLDKKLVTSIGIQGFPWVSNAKVPRREIFHASEFLQPDIAMGAAQELRTRDIWFNTGTFATKYTNDKSKTVYVTASDRKAILADILDVANKVRTFQQNEYRVAVNLFAEDKSDTNEATDWSYFQDSESTNLFKDFVRQADDMHIGISISDQEKEK
jgi:hypothetical protein